MKLKIDFVEAGQVDFTISVIDVEGMEQNQNYYSKVTN